MVIASYIIEQKITVFANQYRVYSADTDGAKTGLIAFAQQKRIALKEEIKFYPTEQKTGVIFSVKAEKVMDIHGRFLVLDAKGNLLGSVRKKFESSLLRSTWEMADAHDVVVTTVTEKSPALAIFRRVWGFIPVVGEIPFIIKYGFVFLRPNTQDVLADYTKTTLLRDHYRLDINSDELLSQLGWQSLVVQAVLLDALQGR